MFRLPTRVDRPLRHSPRIPPLPFLIAAALLWLPLTLVAQLIGGRWDPSYGWNGATGPVRSLAAGDCDIYAVGDFSPFEASEGNYVIRWDGETWSTLGGAVAGRADGAIERVVVDGSEVYAVGGFHTIGGVTANGVARFNGTDWEAIGGGVGGDNFTVNDIAVFGRDIFIAGTFTTAGGVPVTNLARWSGFAQSWSAIPGGVEGFVYDLMIEGDWLYIGGKFDRAGGADASNIVRFNILSGTWDLLGGGTNDSVMTISVADENIYAGGAFTAAGGGQARHIAVYNRSAGRWSELAGGADATVRALILHEGDLFAGGDFTTLGGRPALHAGLLVDGSWQELSSGTDGPVYAAASCDERLCVGGTFQQAGGGFAPYVASWSFPGWSALLPDMEGGLNDRSNAVALADNNTFYIGGRFTTAGDVRVNGVAFRNGSAWESLGGGVDGEVLALDYEGDELYVGGLFTTAGGQSVANVARWNATTKSWSPLGAGVNGVVRSITIDTNYVYVGGDFTSAGGAPAGHIARWNRTTNGWESIGEGTNGPVHVVALINSNLMVGGGFTRINGADAENIGGFHRITLNGYGYRVNDTVRAIARGTDRFYIGGDFTAGDGGPVNHIAFRGPDRWHSLEDGISDGVRITTVYALDAVGDDLFVGGEFMLASGVPVAHIAQWNGVSWTTLGSGMHGILPSVRGIAASEEQVAIAGDFISAGDTASVNVAVWIPQVSSVPFAPSASTGSTISVRPNPVRSVATISLGDDAITGGEIRLYDLLGRPVAEARFGPNGERAEIDLSGLPTGVYTVETEVDGRRIVTTIIRN